MEIIVRLQEQLLELRHPENRKRCSGQGATPGQRVYHVNNEDTHPKECDEDYRAEDGVQDDDWLHGPSRPKLPQQHLSLVQAEIVTKSVYEKHDNNSGQEDSEIEFCASAKSNY